MFARMECVRLFSRILSKLRASALQKRKSMKARNDVNRQHNITQERLRRIWTLVFFSVLTVLRNLIWALPSPLMQVITSEMGISYARGGMLMYVVTIMMGVFMLIGSLLIDRIGAVKAMWISMLCFAADGAVAMAARSYALLLMGRVMSGIGYGLSACALAVMVAERFKPGSRLAVNSFNAAMNSIGLIIAYAVTIPLYQGLAKGSWQMLLLIWSACILLLCVAFIIMERRLRMPDKAIGSSVSNDIRDNPIPNRSNSKLSILLALGFRQTRCMIVAMFGGMWCFTCFNTYLPMVLEQTRGISAAVASAAGSLISVGSLLGCLFCALRRGGIRKPRAMMLLLVAGLAVTTFGAVLMRGIPMWACICLLGFCFTAWSTMAGTSIMCAPGMTPKVYGAANALYLGVGSICTFLVPAVFDGIQQAAGMDRALLFFCGLTVLCVGGMLFYPRDDRLPS